MKILIPVLGFGQSGGYRVLSKLANELILLGHCVEFLCVDGENDPYFPTLAKINWVDKRGLITTERRKDGKKETAFSIQRKLTKALRKISNNSYDVIIANHSLTTFPIWLAGLRHKTLYYVQAYEPEFYQLPGGLKNKVLARLSEFSYKLNLFTVVNSKIYTQYKKLKASRALYPGIDFELFYPKAVNIKRETDKIIIGTVGRLEKYKGTRYIIDAFNTLRKSYPNVELHVAFGDPKDFEDYKDIHCFHPHGDIQLGDFYRSLDYYICAAYIQFGAFHYPVCEAMSCGIPVITTCYYPANESNAWLIGPENTLEIVNQFEVAFNSRGLKQKKVEQALVDMKQFDWKLVVDRLNFYLKELTATDKYTKATM